MQGLSPCRLGAMNSYRRSLQVLHPQSSIQGRPPSPSSWGQPSLKPLSLPTSGNNVIPHRGNYRHLIKTEAHAIPQWHGGGGGREQGRQGNRESGRSALSLPFSRPPSLLPCGTLLWGRSSGSSGRWAGERGNGRRDRKEMDADDFAGGASVSSGGLCPILSSHPSSPTF